MNYYNGVDDLSPEVFHPRRNEATGISVYREKYKSIEDAAKGRSKHGYFVAVLRTGDLRDIGVRVVPWPLPDDPGHAQLPDLNCDNRREPITEQRKFDLAKVCLKVVGPFPSSNEPAS
jgi:hypothetical protein